MSTLNFSVQRITINEKGKFVVHPHVYGNYSSKQKAVDALVEYQIYLKGKGQEMPHFSVVERYLDVPITTEAISTGEVEIGLDEADNVSLLDKDTGRIEVLKQTDGDIDFEKHKAKKPSASSLCDEIRRIAGGL